MSNRADDRKVNSSGGEESDVGDLGAPTAESIIDSDVEMKGDLVARGSVKLGGKFKGRLTCNETLSVGTSGVATGEVEAVNVVIPGKVDGDVLARKRLEIQSGGTFFGELLAQPEVLVLSETAQFGRERPKPDSQSADKVVEIPKGASQGPRPSRSSPARKRDST